MMICFILICITLPLKFCSSSESTKRILFLAPLHPLKKCWKALNHSSVLFWSHGILFWKPLKYFDVFVWCGFTVFGSSFRRLSSYKSRTSLGSGTKKCLILTWSSLLKVPVQVVIGSHICVMKSEHTQGQWVRLSWESRYLWHQRSVVQIPTSAKC